MFSQKGTLKQTTSRTTIRNSNPVEALFARELKSKESNVSLTGKKTDKKQKSDIVLHASIPHIELTDKAEEERVNYILDMTRECTKVSFYPPLPMPSSMSIPGGIKKKQKRKVSGAKSSTTTKQESVTGEVETQPENKTEKAENTKEIEEVLDNTTSLQSSLHNRQEDNLDMHSVCTSSVTLVPDNIDLIKRNNDVTSNETTEENKENDIGVTINVYDYEKNNSRDFFCSQRLLNKSVGHFANMTAEQRLEAKNLSIHCDVDVFDWLMKWIHYDNMEPYVSINTPDEDVELDTSAPQLNSQIVMPILVASIFLQIEKLMSQCLSFCRINMNAVIEATPNFSTFDDIIITRVADIFTNLEIEMLDDNEERVTSCLWNKLIQNLCDPRPNALRGHYYSMSEVFCCASCQCLTTNSLRTYVGGMPANMCFNTSGCLKTNHKPDPCWNLSEYVMDLFIVMNSMRKVYWKLWAHCHILYCTKCEAYFPVYQMNCCRYHPEAPNYLDAVREDRTDVHYDCCGEKLMHFEKLPGSNGCQFREHSVLMDTNREHCILVTAMTVNERHELFIDPNIWMEQMKASGDITKIWQSFSQTPEDLNAAEYDNVQGYHYNALTNYCDDSSDSSLSNISINQRTSNLQISPQHGLHSDIRLKNFPLNYLPSNVAAAADNNNNAKELSSNDTDDDDNEFGWDSKHDNLKKKRFLRRKRQKKTRNRKCTDLAQAYDADISS